MWSFLWSSIQVRVLLLGIRSFPVLVCRKWRLISWIRKHVIHYGLAFFKLIFYSTFLSKLMCISTFGPSSGHSSSSYVVIYPLGLFVVFFGSQIVRFLLHPVPGTFLCHLLPFVDGNFFCSFGMSCFVGIILRFVYIYVIFLL